MNRNCIRSVVARPYEHDPDQTEWKFELEPELYQKLLAALVAEIDRLFDKYAFTGGHCPALGEYCPGENWCWAFITPKGDQFYQGIDDELPVNLANGCFSIILDNHSAPDNLDYTAPSVAEPEQWMRATSAFKQTIAYLNITL